jgi:hypothetical protein
LTAATSIGAVDDVVAVAIGSTGTCGTEGRSGIAPGAAETGTAGVVPVESEPRMAGLGLLAPGFCVASLLGGAVEVLMLVFSAALPAGLVAGFALVLVSLLVSVLVPAVLLFVLSAVLSDLAPDLVSVFVLVLVSAFGPGRAFGNGGSALVLVDVCADANAPHVRMPQAASRTVSRISRTLPPAANA